MAGDLLSGASEAVGAIVAQELNGGLIGTGYLQRAAVEAVNFQSVEPNSCINGIERFGTINNVGENVLNVSNCQAKLP